jgi:hypothetical protein
MSNPVQLMANFLLVAALALVMLSLWKTFVDWRAMSDEDDIVEAVDEMVQTIEEDLRFWGKNLGLSQKEICERIINELNAKKDSYD